MKISFWKDEEVKNLFSFVESEKNKNKKMTAIFKEFASISGRKPNSIRNYYYLELQNAEKSSLRLKNLGIDINNHIVKKNNKFSDNETQKLIEEITRLKSLGYSVRSACHKLAGGDLNKMVRLQNKYRVLCSKDKNTESRAKMELSKKGFITDNNIITMPTLNKGLSDSDINSLFMGLVKLVKKSALENANRNLIKDVEFANDSLRKALVKLSQKESQIKEIRKEFKILSQENQNLKEEILDLKCKQINKSTKSVKKLADFVDNLKSNDIKIAKH